MSDYSFDSSQNNMINCDINEIRIDKKLCDTFNKNSIKGYVLDEDKNSPLEGVCIKITDKDYNPLVHIFTNKSGYFEIEFCFPVSIRIIVAKKYYETYSSGVYYINDFNLQNLEIKLKSNCYYNNIIIGLLQTENKKPAQFVEVNLTLCSDRKVQYATYTNEEGHYIFQNIPSNIYVLTFTSAFYNKYSVRMQVKPCTEIINLRPICLKFKNLGGTLSGVIKDCYGHPLNNIIVILMDKNNDMPITFTHTNSDGVYLFYNLKLGSYYILSK